MGVLTAPLAVITVNDQFVGTMKNITVTEQFAVEQVVGIGNFEAQELPRVSFTGEASCESYNLDYYRMLNAIDDARGLLRTVESAQEFVDTVLLNETGLDINIYRKVTDTTASNGAITTKNVLFATLQGAIITQDGFTISEGQISSRNTNFRFRSGIKRLV